MTKTFLMSTGLAAISGIMLAMTMTSTGAEARTTMQLDKCASGSRGKTVTCCEAKMENGRFLGSQKLAGKNCSKAVACMTYGNGRRCHVLIVRTDNVPRLERNDRTTKSTESREQRGKSTNY